MIYVRPQDVGEEDSIVYDLGEFGVVFDGEGYFGFNFAVEYEYSEIMNFEGAQQWCLDRAI